MSAPRMSGQRATGPRHLDQDALTVWMFLLKEGGYWQARELGRELISEPMVSTVRSQCDRLLVNGMVRSRQLPGRHASFGVTPSCTAPPGYEWMLEAALSATGPINWGEMEARHWCGLGDARGQAAAGAAPA